jgi:DNA-binding MarR family transcriptional regulator
METRNKNYWRPLWKGLVIDPEAKHCKRIGNSVWLFLYFILKADYKTGFLFKSYEAMARETGVKKRTIRHWLNNLKNKGYVSIQRKRNGFRVYVRNWKTINQPQKPVSAPSRRMT